MSPRSIFTLLFLAACTSSGKESGDTDPFVPDTDPDADTDTGHTDPPDTDTADTDTGDTDPGEAPTAEMLLPAADGAYFAGSPIVVQARVDDAEDAADTLTVGWTDEAGAPVEVDATPTDGLLEGLVTLAEGARALTVTVTDSSGRTGSATVSFVVGPTNAPPVCAITSPEDGGNAEVGALVQVTGRVVDPEGMALTAAWSSDREGAIGDGTLAADGATAFTIDTLGFGTHVLTLAAVDALGGTCSADIVFSIGTPPVASIDAPRDGDLYNDDQWIDFVATISDEGTASETLSVLWESDRDGLLDGTAADASGLVTFATDGLSAGEHVITLTVTDLDGLYAEAEVGITVNGLPLAPVLTIDPTAPLTTDTLSASVQTAAYDAEGDAISYAWSWTADGVRTAHTTAVVPEDATTRGEVWIVTAVPNDGWGDGTPATASVTIGNTPPSVATVTLSPDPIWEGGTLACTPSEPVDADGDPVTWIFEWSVNGVGIAAASSELGDAWWRAGDRVTCAVTPFDGTDAGPTVISNEVSVDNTAPSIAAVAITPDPARASDTLTCAASGFADVDGDADATLYAWTVNGAAAGAGATLAGAFVGGDLVGCTATPFDGVTSGAPLSVRLVIANSPPVLASVALTPEDPLPTDLLICAPGATSDADGTATFTYTYGWTVNGEDLGISDDTYAAAGLEAGDRVICRATPNDGIDDGATVASNPVGLGNSAPVMVSVSLRPTAPFTGDLVTADASASDRDGDDLTFAYAWYVNDVLVAETGGTLAGATWFDRDDEVRVVVTPDDGIDTGAPLGSNAVTVENSVPTITGVVISPDPATAASSLTCTSVGYLDADADPEATTFAWTIDGAAAGTGPTLATGFVDGDEVACVGTPGDGTVAGEARSTLIVIGNLPPVLASVRLDPSPADNTSTFTCTPGPTTDPDGGTSFTYTYAWTVNGVLLPRATATLETADFARGDEVACIVTPNDGGGNGAAVTSNTVTVDDAAPVVDSVTLSSLSPATNDILTATVLTSDADEEPVTVSYAWYVNGSLVATSETLAGATGFDRDDTVSLTVTPSDGTLAGAPLGSAVATVRNTAPSLTSATITPATAYAATTLTCTGGGYADADGDPDLSVVTWTIDGAPAGVGGTLSGGFTGGDVVACTVTPHDGTSAGTAIESAGRTISNTAPVLASVSLTPLVPDKTTPLTCTPGAVSDADGGPLSYAYAWYVNGAVIAPVTNTLSGAWFFRNDIVSCRVTPSDGQSAGATVASNSVSIANAVPVIGSVTLAPTLVYTNDTLTAAATATDADDDAFAFAYAWYVNGSPIGAAGPTLSGSTWFGRGDTVYVRVSAFDSRGPSLPVQSSTVTIGNTAPTAPLVYADPEDPEVGLDDLTCAIDLASTDADGDPLTYAFTWTRNGVAYTGASDTATTSTVPAAAAEEGDLFVCAATASDGASVSAAGTVTIQVGLPSYYVGHATELTKTSTVNASYAYAQAVTVTTACELSQLGLIGKQANGAQARLALYTDDAGVPGALLAETEAGAVPVGRLELDLLDGRVTLEPGTYWVAVIFSASAKTASDTGTASDKIHYVLNSYAAGFPESLGTTSFTGQIHNWYLVVR